MLNELTENYKPFMNKIAYLYSNLESLPIKNKEKVKSFLEEIVVNDGLLNVVYKKGSHPRLYAKNTSIQDIESVVTNFILENSEYVEIDMSSAISNVIELICENNGIQTQQLKYYNRNRQSIIDKLYDGDKDKLKAWINKAFCSKVEEIQTTNIFEENLLKDIKIIQDHIYDNLDYEHYKNIAMENQLSKNQNNFKGSLLSYVYSEIETEIVQKAISFYTKETNKVPFCIKFDGFIAPRVSQEFIEQLNKHTGFIFTIKEINNKKIDSFIQDKQYEISNIKAQYYINILNKNKISLNDYSDGNIADTAILLFGQDYICVDETFYVYIDDNWVTSSIGLINNTMCDKLLKVYRTLSIHYNSLIMKMTAESDEYKSHKQKLTDLNKLIDKIESTSGSNNVFSKFKNKLITRRDKIQFNISLPDIVVFDNIAFNVNNGIQYKVKKTDYNTYTTGYEYVKPTRKQLNEVEQLFISVFPNEEIRKCYLSILKSSLKGERQEKFIMATGRGRNGKGMLNELMLMTLGPEYSYSGNITALTRPLKDGPNPELAGLHLKRFVKYEEPNNSDKILLGNIKKLTGEAQLNARACHSNQTQIRVLMTSVFECNTKPNLDGDIGDAEIERFILTQFENYFTDDPEELKNNPKARPINTKLKTLEYQKNIRCAFFDYIVKYGENTIYVPECVKKITRQYLLENDDLFSFFQDSFEKTANNEDMVTIKQIMNAFKKSQVYECLTKQQKRKYTEAKLKEKIEQNPELRKSFKPKYKNINSVIVGWKPKQEIIEECEIEDI